MDFDEAKAKLLYSKAMKANHGKASKVDGYVSEGEYTRTLETNVARVSRNNGLNGDYARFLAIARSIGVPPYGKEGKEALKQLLGNNFSQAQVTMSLVERILNSRPEDYVFDDVAFLNDEGINGSREAKAVKATEDVMRMINNYSDAEIEQMGGSLLEPTLLDGIQIGEDGNVVYSEFLAKVKSFSDSREKGLDEKAVEEAKKRLQQKMVEAAVDEPTTNLDKILGE